MLMLLGDVSWIMGAPLAREACDIENSRQFLVFHVYQFKGFCCGVLVNSRNSGNFIANEADLVHGQGVFVLGNRKQAPVAIFDFGCVFSGDDTFDAWQGSGFAHVNVMIRAWASGLLRSLPCSMPGSLMSSV